MRLTLEASEATRGRSPLLFLFITVFVDMLGYGIVVPLLPFYAREFASSALLVGLLGSLYAGMQFVGGPFLGGLSDRVGRRPILVSCLLGASLAYLMLGLAGTLPLLVVAVALAGGAAGTVATAQAYIADSTTPEHRARGLGLIGAAFGLGLMTGPALGGLFSLYSLHAPAFAASALALGNATFGILVLPESLPGKLRTPTPLLGLNPVSQLRGVLGMGNIRVLLLVVLLLNLSFAGLLTNFPLFSNVRFGWDASTNAFLFAFVGVCAVLTQGVLIRKLQPIFGDALLLLGGLAIMAVGLGLVAVAPFGSLLYPVVGVLALGAGLAIPALTSIISRRVSGREQGKLMGGVQAILSLALISGPIISGLAFDHLGVPAPYWIGALLASLALLIAASNLLPRIREGSLAANLAREPLSGSQTPSKPREPGA
ncbi:MAG TPA: MFS transporter [Rubrobacteraceae bacterium]|nr:MFS transporter [Rubrobacteraceae bacterium]